MILNKRRPRRPAVRRLRVEFWQSNVIDDWYWIARARNGHKVADSGEGYRRRVDAVRGARAALKALQRDLEAAAKAK